MLELSKLAKLEERRLCLGLESVAAERRWLKSGGIMTRGEPGTWINTSAGLGMTGPVSADELDALIDWFQSVKIEPRIDVCPYADESLMTGLAARGFTLKQFENVFFRELGATEDFTPPMPLADGLTIGLIDGGPQRVLFEYAAAVAEGFTPAGVQSNTADVELWVRVLRQPTVRAYAAFSGKRIVGGGAMEIHEHASGPDDGRVSALFGLSVLPEYRRKGVQQALIAARLAAARDAGAVVATVGALPGVATERNARRMGFQVGYTKAILARPAADLIPNL